MSNLLHISAGISGSDSLSRSLGARLVKGLASKTGASIETRNLADSEPPLISIERFKAGLVPADERSAAQSELAAIGTELIDELKAADTIVFSCPMYNFNVPASVKAWADLVARAGTTFRYTENGPEPLLEKKTAYIVATSGGVPIGSDMDMMTPWLRFFLGFLGIETEELIYADGIMGVDADEKIAKANERIDALIG